MKQQENMVSKEEYKRYNPQEKKVYWTSLKIFSLPIEEDHKPEILCGACKKLITEKEPNKFTDCEHLHHSKCIEKLPSDLRFCLLCNT